MWKKLTVSHIPEDLSPPSPLSHLCPLLFSHFSIISDSLLFLPFHLALCLLWIRERERERERRDKINGREGIHTPYSPDRTRIGNFFSLFLSDLPIQFLATLFLLPYNFSTDTTSKKVHCLLMKLPFFLLSISVSIFRIWNLPLFSTSFFVSRSSFRFPLLLSLFFASFSFFQLLSVFYPPKSIFCPCISTFFTPGQLSLIRFCLDLHYLSFHLSRISFTP